MLSELLDGVRARGALFQRTIMNSPWSLRFASGSRHRKKERVRGRSLPPDPVGAAHITRRHT
ncbi:cupin domain-containing protein [Streptomyces sp. NPDC055721]